MDLTKLLFQVNRVSLRTLSAFVLINLFWAPLPSAASFDLAVKNVGIALGNAEKEGKSITGLNLTIGIPGKKPFEKINGLSLGLVAPYAKQFNGVAGGLLSVHAHPSGKIRGLAFAGLTLEGEDIRGIILSGGPVVYRQFHGIALGGLGIGGVVYEAERFTGIAVNGIWIQAVDFKGFGVAGMHALIRGQMDGFMLGLLRTDIGTANGVIIGGGFMEAKSVRGISAGLINRPEEMRGISIGLFNSSKTLKGLQIGVINHAANNPRFLRWLPLINFNLF